MSGSLSFMFDAISRLVVYGCVGLLIEVFFTGIHSIIFMKNRNAICRTSLWMIPIYGFGALALGWLRSAISNSLVFIPVAVLFIFKAEFISGWMLRKIRIQAWDYSHAKFGIMGLIRLDYLPFWFMVAVAYDVLADYVSRILEFVGTLA